MIKFRQLFAITVIGLALAACETAGQGPVTLSRTAAAAFDEYKEVDFPYKAFAISEDGQEYMYMWCAATACSGSLAGDTVYNCDLERRKNATSDRACRILAVGDTVVWQGEVTFPDTVTAYRLNVAEGAKHRGPEASLGAIIYAPGHDPDYDLPPDDNSVPMYVRSMQTRGWDAFKAVTNDAQVRGALSRERAAEGLRRHIADLRAAGYGRVAVASQSFGAWVSLVGGSDPETWADVNIASVPGCCGPRFIDGKVNDRFQRNRPELRRVLRELKTPTMIIYFAGDTEYEDPGRAAVAIAALERNGVEYRVIDKPLGFAGHSAAWTVQFDFVFGECIADFAAGSPGTEACNAPELAEANHLWITKEEDLDNFPASVARETDLRANIGNTIIGYRSDGDRAAYYLRSETETVAKLRRGYDAAREIVVPSRIDGSKICLEQCYTIYHWLDDFIVAVDESGDIAFQGTILKGNPRNIGVASPSS